MKNRALHNLFLSMPVLALPLILGGCTEAEEDHSSPSLAGIYTSSHVDQGSAADQGFTLIDQAGETIALLPDGSYARGHLWVDHEELSGNLELWSGGRYWTSTRMAGERAYDGLLYGHIYEHGGSTLAVTFDPQPRIYQHASSLHYLNDTWTEWNARAGIQTTFTVEYDGLITGSDSTGCVYSGSVTTPDRDFNLYRVAVRVDRCQGYDADQVEGFYTGFAFLIESHGGADQWVILMDNGRMPLVFMFER